MPKNLPLADPVFEKDVVILSGHGAFPVDSNTLVRKEITLPAKFTVTVWT
jgi:hypothetical protein